MDPKDIFGGLSVAIAIFGILPYIYSFYKGDTKPHAFSWLAWGILCLVQFISTFKSEAGAGSWVFFITTLTYLSIGLAALKWGNLERTKSDYIAFAFAIIAAILLFFTNNYMWAVIIAAFGDAVSFYHTYRKSWSHPHEENISAYWLGALMMVCSLLAIEAYTFTTVLSPASLAIMNIGLTVFLLVRRKT